MHGVVDREFDKLEPILEKVRDSDRSGLLPTLLAAQEIYGYLPEGVVEAIGQVMRIPLAEIYGVIEFYSMLYIKPMNKEILRICTSPMCAIAGGVDHYQRLENQLTDQESGSLEEVTCLGLCDHAPAALVGSQAVYLPADLQLAGKPPVLTPAEPSVIRGDPRWITQRIGMDPTDIQAYQDREGFEGLRRALNNMSPGQVIQEVKSSGLWGRGGAAFPTGLKWELTAAANEPERYLVCNADESEPGTFKDRALLEGDPFSVLEGMILAAYAIDARQGYLFIRGEYPHAQSVMAEAIQIAREQGFLGDRILGSPFSFEVELRSGAGAYICGEETALFEAIEGKRGFPRLKPPYPTTHGLFGKPTLINNVETLSAVSWILAHGSETFRSLGTSESPGTKLFCVSGDVHQRGIYEVPFGITLGEIIELAGGVQGELKGVLLGGAAGTFVDSDELELKLNFEDLRSSGHSLGSGVVFVFNRNRDISVILRSLAEFFAHESCGKCYPCQLGTQRQMEIIEQWAGGQAGRVEREALEDVIFTMSQGSICGLGMTAGMAIQSAFRNWPELWGSSQSFESKGEQKDG